MSTPDFFRSRLDAMIDLRHPLAVLATKMSWASIETTLAPLFERRSRDGRLSEAVDLFGPNSLELAGGVSAAGRPRLPMRLMVGLLYLKHAYNESDETVCERWAQDVYFQILSRNPVERIGFQGVGAFGWSWNPRAEARRLRAAMLRCLCCSS